MTPHSVRPSLSMVHPPTALPPLPSAPEQTEDLDYFADVSHHGSSLFEFLSFDPVFAATASPQHPLHTEPCHPSISDTTASPSELPCSASTSHTAPYLPHTRETLHHENIDSYSTADLAEQASKPILQPSYSSPLSKQHVATSSRTPPPARKKLHHVKQTPNRTPPSNSIPKQKTAVTPRKPLMPPTKAIVKPRTPTRRASGRATARRKLVSNVAGSRSDVASRSADALGESEASDQSEAVRKPVSKEQSPRLVTPNGDASSLVDEAPGKDTHNSHTRRCRAKVNSKFQELLSILPTPPPKTGIKHKAQILDYTILVFRDIHARKMLLEAELALSSRSQLNSWIENVVTRSVTLQDALAPYLSLICTKGGWKYSEAWVPVQNSLPNTGQMNGISGESRVLTPTTLSIGPSSRLRMGIAVIPALGNTDDPDLVEKLNRFRDQSRSYSCKARVDLPGRVMCTMRPEWLPSLEDQEAFRRARLARAANLVVCFGVPIFVHGHIAAVAVFFDTEKRPYDAKGVDLADNLAGLLGNSYGSSTFRRKAM